MNRRHAISRLCGLGFMYSPVVGADDLPLNIERTVGRPHVNLDEIRKAARAAWLLRTAALKEVQLPIVGIGSPVYIDPSRFEDGLGTLEAPLRALPVMAQYKTYLFREGTTWTGSRAQRTALLVTQSGIVLGTYENSTGRRVFDPERLATIDANGAQFGIGRSAGESDWSVSGLRVVNARHATQPIGIHATGERCVVEYCMVEDILPLLDSPHGSGIASRSRDSVIRFNTIRVANVDAIRVSDGGLGGDSGQNPQIVGNDIEILGTTTHDGPDGIQLFHATTFNSFRIEANWIKQSSANVKQCIMISENSFSLKEGSIAYNYCEGCDVSFYPKLGKYPQKGMELEAPNLSVWCNIVIGAERGINVNAVGQADIRGNLVVQIASDGPQHFIPMGISVSGATGASFVEHNTVVMAIPHSGSRGIQFSGSVPHRVSGNIVLGPWDIGIRNGNATFESKNLIFGAALSTGDSLNRRVATGEDTSDALSPNMSNLFQLLNPAIRWTETKSGPRTDVYGHSWSGKVGAIQ